MMLIGELRVLLLLLKIKDNAVLVGFFLLLVLLKVLISFLRDNSFLLLNNNWLIALDLMETTVVMVVLWTLFLTT
jgi:hypothetical protein